MFQANNERNEVRPTLVKPPDRGNVFEACVWGARGSLPASGPDFNAFGGETSCVELRFPVQDNAERVIIIDAGTGILELGKKLKEEGVREIDLVFSHLHYDHVIGLPFFAPIHDSNVRLRIHYGGNEQAPTTDEGVQTVLRDYLRQPFFPVSMDCFRANVTTHVLPTSGLFIEGIPNLRIEHRPLKHPGGATGYRFERGGSVFAYITDFEHDSGAYDRNVLDLARAADVALMDATYTPEDYRLCAGWGHAHWAACGELASRAGARSWGLFHHQHQRTDDELRAIGLQACAAFPNAFVAYTGQHFALTQDAAHVLN